MAEVIWRNAALDQLDEARAFIRQLDPEASDRIFAKLIAVGESAAKFPRRGRPAGFGRCEMVTVPPYVLTYEVVGEEVRIIDIRHGRRRRLGD